MKHAISLFITTPELTSYPEVQMMGRLHDFAIPLNETQTISVASPQRLDLRHAHEDIMDYDPLTIQVLAAVYLPIPTSTRFSEGNQTRSRVGLRTRPMHILSLTVRGREIGSTLIEFRKDLTR